MQYIVLSLKVSKDEKIVLSRWHVVNSTIIFGGRGAIIFFEAAA